MQHLRRVLAALDGTVDAADGFGEADAVDHRIVGRHLARATLGHPEPQPGLPRDRRVLLDQAGVVQQVEAECVTGGLVVVVPAQLERAAAVVGRLPGRMGLAGVGVVRVVGRVDLDHVDQPAGLLADVRQESRGLLLPDRGAAGPRERGIRRYRRSQSGIRIEAFSVREHLVELGFAHYERRRLTTARHRRRRVACRACIWLPVPGADGRIEPIVLILGLIELAILRKPDNRTLCIVLARRPIRVRLIVARRGRAGATGLTCVWLPVPGADRGIEPIVVILGLIVLAILWEPHDSTFGVVLTGHPIRVHWH